MTFEEEPTTPFITLDKMPAMNGMAKAAMQWHREVRQYLEDIQKSSLEITKFLVGEIATDMENLRKVQTATKEELARLLSSKTELRHPIIYPYRPETQYTFEKNISLLITASHAIYPVILNIQKEINESLKPQPPNQPTGMGSSATVYVEQPKKRFEWPFRREQRPMENVTDITPYSRSVDLIDELMQVPVLARIYKKYHWERVIDSMTILKDRQQAQLNRLALEIVYFHSNVGPRIETAVGEASRINLLSEKQLFAPMLSHGQQIHERREMQPQPFQPTG